MRCEEKELIVDDPLGQTALTNILSARSDVEHFKSADDAIELGCYIAPWQNWILQEITLGAQCQSRKDKKDSRR
jgi:hypothetical protein